MFSTLWWHLRFAEVKDSGILNLDKRWHEWSPSRSSHLPPGKITGAHWLDGRSHNRAGHGVKEKNPILAGDWTPILLPVANHVGPGQHIIEIVVVVVVVLIIIIIITVIMCCFSACCLTHYKWNVEGVWFDSHRIWLHLCKWSDGMIHVTCPEENVNCIHTYACM
jgi:hypothetical protein